MTANLLDFDLEGLAAFCEGLGEKRFRATQLFRWIHQRGASDFDQMTDLAREFRDKLKQLAEKTMTDPKLLQAVRDSAQEIWQAGLGAFAKAQQEGTKLFEALVKEGEGLSKKTRSVAEGKINEVTGNVSKAATQISSKAQAQATELTQRLATDVKKAADLDNAAKANGLTVQETGFFAKDEPILGVGSSPEMTSRAFAMAEWCRVEIPPPLNRDGRRERRNQRGRRRLRSYAAREQ